MNKPIFINITNKLSEYSDQIGSFVRQLDYEKEFFDLTTERVMRCELVIIALSDSEIIGITALERKYGFVRSLTMVKKDYQGKGLGKQLHFKQFDEAKKTHNIIIGIVDEKNKKAFRNNLVTGYRIGGKRGNLFYMLNPLNTKGLFLYYLIKTLFPIMKVVDLIR